MDKISLTQQYIQEKFNNNQDAINNFILPIIADGVAETEDFQSWLKVKKSHLEASSTTEALEAQKKKKKPKREQR